MKTIKNVSLMKNLRYIFALTLIIMSGNLLAETETIYYESFGSTSDNTAYNEYTGYSATASMFTNATASVASHYSGDGKVGRNDVGGGGISSGYTGASGLSGVWHQGVANTEKTILTISGINIQNYANLSLSFGAMGGSSTHKIIVTYSIDGGEEKTLISAGTINNSNWTLLTQALNETGNSLTLHFKHKPTTTWTIRLDDIKLTGEAASCDNRITITKGTESHGTFTISPVGETCADDPVTVSVTNISPASGYVASVITTSASGTPSAIANGTGSVTGISASTTIGVTFVPKTSATLTKSVLGNTSDMGLSGYYIGDQVTLPGCDVVKQGYVFYGWSTTPFSESEYDSQTIYKAGDKFTLTQATQTLYVVYAVEEGTPIVTFANFTASDSELDECQFVIGAKVGSTYYAMSNAFSSSEGRRSATDITAKLDNGTLLPADAANYVVTFVKDGSDFRIKNASYYLIGTSGTSFKGRAFAEYDNYDNRWSISTSAAQNGTYRIKNTKDTRAIAYSSDFGHYSTGNITANSAYYDCEIIPVGSGYTYSGFATRFITYQNFAYKCTYDITYTLGDGHAWVDGYTAPATYDHNKNGEAIILPTGDNLVGGQYFRGWYDNAELTGDPITSLAVTGNGDKTVYAAWADVVNFYVQGDIAETQTIDADKQVTGYTPTATCTGKKFMGWSSVNQTELIQDPVSLNLFTNFIEKEFAASTDLYAVYAAYNGGKPSETEYHKENSFTTEEQGFWDTSANASFTTNNSNVRSGGGAACLKMPKSSTTEVYITTKEKIENLSKISFYIKKSGGSYNKFTAQFSIDGTNWVDMNIADKPTGANFDYTEVEATMPSVQSAYVRIVAQPANYGDDYYFYVDDVTFYNKPAQYWYSDYSTNCAMAESATISYNGKYSYTATTVGETMTISDNNASKGYQLYSLTIKGQTYNEGEKYILAHDVTPEAADIRPVMTWTERYNNPAQWTQTSAPNENGKLVLPTTQPASFAPGLYEFYGWTSESFDNSKTVAPAIVTAETDAPTAPTTYYAVYRKQNNTGEGYTYRQTTPSTLYQLTYSPNGGDGTDYITYTDLTTATTPASNLFTREGATLVGWTLDPNAETIEYVGTSTQITNIDGDRHYYAVWIGELEMSSDIALTSASGATVGSATFTLSSKNLGTITALRFSYKDVDNDITYSGTSGETARSKSEFRLCNESYNIDENNLDVSTISTNFSHTYTIIYAPNSGNKMSHYKLVVELLNKSKVMTTQEFDLLGRALPDQFVIAECRDNKWYALPANINDEAKARPGVEITVSGEGLEMIAHASANELYSLATYSHDKNKALFKSSVNDGHLWAASGDNTGIRNYATTISGENAAYAWILTPTDETLITYTLGNVNNNRTLSMYGTDFGMYSSYGTNTVYFLPLAQEMSIGEWYSDKLLFGEPKKLTDISVQLNGESQDEKISVSRKTYLDNYNLYELSGIDFAAAAGQTMLITKTIENGTKYYSGFTVPTFVKTVDAVNASTLADGVDVVVRDGGTLNVDAAKTLGQLTICPNSKVIVSADITLTVDSLIFFAGIEDEDKYGVPELVLNGTLVSHADTIMYRMRVDAEQMYTVAFPYNVQVKDITRPDGLAIRDGEKVWTGSLWMETYDGANRAKGGRRDSETDKSWKQDAALGETLLAGMGYTVSAPRLRAKSKYAYSLIDFPMAIPMPDEQTEGDATIVAELSQPKGAVSVTAHKQEGANNRTDWGWNLLANPYMSTIGGADYRIQVSGASENYDVVTMLTDDGEQYYQFIFNESSEALRPFKHFFLQVGENGTFCFSPDLAASAPRYLAAQEQGSVDFALTISGDNTTDITYFRINNRYTDEYEIGADVVKMCSAQTQLYSLFGEEGLFRIATAAENDNKFIPLGYHTAMSGSFTFAMAANAAINNVEHIYLLENGEAVADLLRDSYTFETPAGTNNNRFAIWIVMHNGQAPTSIFGTDDGGGGPQKIIHNSLMYIIMPDGRVYDTAGDQVNGKEVTK